MIDQHDQTQECEKILLSSISTSKEITLFVFIQIILNVVISVHHFILNSIFLQLRDNFTRIISDST